MIFAISSSYQNKGAVTSTALSTTLLTLSSRILFPHSTLRSSNQTFATFLSTLISTPGTGMPILCNLSISCFCCHSSLSSSDASSLSCSCLRVLEGLLREGRRGIAMGAILSAPNCASRKRKSRSSRSWGVRLAWRLRVGRVN